MSCSIGQADSDALTDKQPIADALLTDSPATGDIGHQPDGNDILETPRSY